MDCIKFENVIFPFDQDRVEEVAECPFDNYDFKDLVGTMKYLLGWGWDIDKMKSDKEYEKQFILTAIEMYMYSGIP